MNSIQKKALKGKILDYLQNKGIKTETIDTPDFVFWTDKPINKNSHTFPNPCKINLIHPYMTSFGEKSAMRFIER